MHLALLNDDSVRDIVCSNVIRSICTVPARYRQTEPMIADMKALIATIDWNVYARLDILFDQREFEDHVITAEDRAWMTAMVEMHGTARAKEDYVSGNAMYIWQDMNPLINMIRELEKIVRPGSLDACIPYRDNGESDSVRLESMLLDIIGMYWTAHLDSEVKKMYDKRTQKAL